jgi:excisionase family DNA binding protein
LEGTGRRRLKISEVAEYLGVTEDHVWQLIAYAHLTAVNVGGTGIDNRYRIAEKELFTLIERSRNDLSTYELHGSAVQIIEARHAVGRAFSIMQRWSCHTTNRFKSR